MIVIYLSIEDVEVLGEFRDAAKSSKQVEVDLTNEETSAEPLQQESISSSESSDSGHFNA